MLGPARIIIDLRPELIWINASHLVKIGTKFPKISVMSGRTIPEAAEQMIPQRYSSLSFSDAS